MRYGVLVILLLVMAGCQSPPRPETAPVVARFWLEANAARTIAVELPVSETKIRVLMRPVISEFDIVDVGLVRVELGLCLMFQLTPSAAHDLYRLSVSNQGSRLVLLVNDRPSGARVIEQPIEGGVLYTFVELPDAELPALVQSLKQTAAAVRLAVAKQQ
jgi:hypothetical protein